MTSDSPATRECIERALHYLRLSRVNARQVEPRMNINDAIFHLEEALKSLPSEMGRSCLWLKDIDGIFHTACGHDLCYDATLKDCGVKFCQCCGGEVKGVTDDA